MMTFTRGKALLHALDILLPQKEYPLQLNKKLNGFRACVDAVEKNSVCPLQESTPSSLTIQILAKDQSPFIVATISLSLLLE